MRCLLERTSEAHAALLLRSLQVTAQQLLLPTMAHKSNCHPPLQACPMWSSRHSGLGAGHRPTTGEVLHALDGACLSSRAAH